MQGGTKRERVQEKQSVLSLLTINKGVIMATTTFNLSQLKSDALVRRRLTESSSIDEKY